MYIQKDDFFRYYSNRAQGTAIVIKRAWRLQDPIELDTIGLLPPQSFCYVPDAVWQQITRRKTTDVQRQTR
jgi:hypothetical protein